MKNVRYGLIALLLLACSAAPVPAQVSIGISLPSVSIGINLPLYPELVLVPGYPVYYAPRLDANYFFYDGMYWVYMNDNWYASSWYNGPWGIVGPEVVPLFILRVPVRYYRQPPLYFRGWQSNAPPRWGQHWGHDWERQRSGWNRWNRSSAPRPAPLPVYQRQYSRDRYPRIEQQQTLRSRQYRYQPRDRAVSQHFKQLDKQTAPVPAPRGRQEAPAAGSPRQYDRPRSEPAKQGGPAIQQPQHQGGAPVQRPAPAQHAPQQRDQVHKDQRPQPKQQQEHRAPAAVPQRRQEAPPVRSPQQQVSPHSAPRQQAVPAQQQPQHQQQAPRPQGQEQRSQGRGNSPEPRADHGQGHNRDEGRGR